MKKFFILLLAMCTLTINVNAQKKEKKPKKEKTEKTYEWTWDGTLSGNETVDNYLITIDTLWNKIQDYSELMDSYDFHQDTITINDQHYIVAYMTTDEGSLVTRATCNWQLVSSISNGALIALQAVNAGAMGINATAALPSLGLKALSYGKYLKGAPNIISLASKEIKEVTGLQKANARTWKSLKNGALSEEELVQLNYFDEKALKNMKRCVYIKEIPNTDPSYDTIVEHQKQKSDEQIKEEAEQIAQTLSSAIITPEDNSKALDDITDEALAKEL